MFSKFAAVSAMLLASLHGSTREVGQIRGHEGPSPAPAPACPGSDLDLPPCFALKSNGSYVTFMPDGGRSYTKIQTHESIKLDKLNGTSTVDKKTNFTGKYGLIVNGLWVAAENDKDRVRANRDKQDTWEAFSIAWNVPSDTISIKTHHNTWIKFKDNTADAVKEGYNYLVTQTETEADKGKFHVVAIKC